MAEGMDENMDLSLTTDGSEAVYDFYCEICRESGLNLEAVGYCVDCEDYLCNTCFTHHKRSRFTLNHAIQGQDGMPRDTPLPHDKCNRYIDSKCNIHIGRTIEYYCKQHDFLGCGACFTKDHRNCSNVDFIPDIPEDFEQSIEYKTFAEYLNSISQRSTDTIRQSRDNITSTENCCKQALLTIRQHREVLNKHLDDLESNLVQHAERIASENVKAVESISDISNTILKNMQKISSKIEILRNSRKMCQLYIAMKEFSNEIKCMTKSLDEAVQKYDVRLYDFVPSSSLTEKMKELNCFGTIHNTSTSIATVNPKASHISDIELRLGKHQSSFNITGLTALSRNKLLYVNRDNNSISLLETESNKHIYELKVENNPWDVCVISRDQAAITTTYSNTIVFIKVTDIMEVERKLRVNGTCRGIAYTRDRLVVSFDYPPKLEIIDLQGSVINKIATNEMGSKLFSMPWYVCLSSDEETIYVSDKGANKVIQMTFDGKIKSDYKDKELCKPYKVCADQRGNIYVASVSKNTIYMLASDCSKIKTLLTGADGLNHSVKSVSYCPETNRLFIGMGGISRIKVFQLQ